MTLQPTPLPSPAPGPILEARGIERRFGGLTVWKGIDLQIGAGELVLLAGPNGTGKTTLLRSLAGLARPPRGTIHLAGQDLYGPLSNRAGIGFVAHDSFLYDDLTARENLQFAAELQQLDASPALIDDALEAAGLSDRANQRVGRFSRGLVQRLALARATLHQPTLLLLDEPFTGLDHRSAAALRRSLGEHSSRGHAIICVTHESAEIWDVTTRVVVLAGKQICLDAPRPDSIDRFREQYIALVA